MHGRAATNPQPPRAHSAAPTFAHGTQELWTLLISANQTGTGIPQKLLDEKADEQRKRREEEERVQVGRWAARGVGGLGGELSALAAC